MSKGKVAVAMSGGIDSSVVAVLLKLQGYDVVGLTMKLWDFKQVGGEDKKITGRCCSLEMFDDARKVCYKYDIPHYVLNMEKDFNKTVIDDFVSEYLVGRTPNPCVVCNNKVKWEVLEQKTKQLECDYLATGHYAQINFDKSKQRYQLLKGVDESRDQSYFLWGMKQDSLARTLFPLGQMQKSEVRELGRKYELLNAEREESREICFVSDDDYVRFLKENTKNLAGAGIIRDTDGNEVGEHDGYYNYTIGQRKRIHIKTTEKKYVTEIDSEKNEIIVGSDDDLFSAEFEVRDINWLSIAPPKEPRNAKIKIRYLHNPVEGELQPLTDSRINVRLLKEERAITPGQSAVFYDGDIVLGGGRII